MNINGHRLIAKFDDLPLAMLSKKDLLIASDMFACKILEGFCTSHQIDSSLFNINNPPDVTTLKVNAIFQKDQHAIYKLADHYSILGNESEASIYYQKAAKWGSTGANAICYKYGYGRPIDETQAFRLLKKAAKSGDSCAEYELGLCYQKGQGVEKCSHKAFEYFQLAAEKGNASAQYEMGIYYDEDDSNSVVEKDEYLNALYLKKAADQGHREAQYEYACLPVADFKTANHYLKLAADNNLEIAQELLAQRIASFQD